MENKKEKIEIEYKKAIKIDSLRLSFLLLYVKETIIFSGVTIILYCNYKLTSMLTSMVYYRYIANNKIEDDIDTQLFYMYKYNSLHRHNKVREYSLSAESLLLENDLKYNSYSLLSYLVIVPVIFGILYLLFIQLNLRSIYRVQSSIMSFFIVVSYFFYIEFNNLLTEGEGIIFIFNCVIPFIISFFLCLFVLLTPKNGKFSYYS